MDLVNATPIPAKLSLGLASDGVARRAVVTAKATFRFRHGSPVLDSQDPWPVFEEVEPYGDELVLPADVAPGVQPHFEVLLVGHASVTTPLQRHEVTMQVGERFGRISVVGDRSWQQTDDGWEPTEPEMFLRMPISWQRAYGGAHQVEIDEGAFAPFVHAPNPVGRGYWPREEALQLAKHLGICDWEPRVPEPGLLPNLESPDEPVERPDQRIALPACWAPMPREYAARYAPLFASVPGAEDADGWHQYKQAMAHRGYSVAHPDWLFEAAPAVNAPVRVTGAGADLSFGFPALRVLAEAQVGDRCGKRELVPQLLTVLPDERALTLTYRLGLRYDYVESERRAIRLSMERE